MRRLEDPPLTVALALAALVAATSSRGDTIVLGLLLAALALRPTAVVAVAAALGASAWRWGDTSLEALAGAQAVLGPAGGVGPTSAAVGSWLAAAALLVAVARRPDPWRSAAVGAAVAAVLAGPAPGGELPIRVIVGVGAAAAAFALGHLRVLRPSADRALGWVAAGLGLGAVAAVAPDAPGWPPATELDTLLEGGFLAIATVAVVLAALALVERARWSDPGVPPIVARPPTRPWVPGARRPR